MSTNPNAAVSNDYFRKGSIVMLSSVIIGYIADYLFNLTLSHALPAHEYGDYKVAFAYATITSVVVLLGGDRVAPRLLAGPLSRGDNRIVWEFLRFYSIIAVSLSALVILITALVSFLHIGTAKIEDHHPLVIMSLVVPLIAFSALVSRILQSAKLLAMSNLPWRIALPLLKTMMVFMILALFSRVQLWQVIAAGALAVCMIIFWQWHEIRKRDLLIKVRATDELNRSDVLKHSIPMMMAMLMTLALNQIDLFMLEALGSEHEVGFFAAAMTTAHLLPVAQVTVAGLFLPLIGQAMEKDRAMAISLFWQGQKVITLVVVVLAVLMFVGGEWLLAFFGNDFLQARLALIYLTIGYALWALAAFFSTWLQYSYKGSQIVAIGCLTLTVDAACNYWLIPLYGLNGAAIATLVSMSVGAVMTWGFYYRSANAHTRRGGNRMVTVKDNA